MEKVSLSEKFQKITDYWRPYIVADLNDHYVKIAKFKGEFVWHFHSQGDELFYVVKGTLIMQLRDDDIVLHAGDQLVVHKGVEHCPKAEEEVCAVLIEPKSFVNTGNVDAKETVEKLEWL